MRLNETFDKKLWLIASIQFFGDILSFGVPTLMPSPVRSFGFDSVLTQLLTVPIFFVAVAIYIAVSFWSDRVQKRAVFMVPGALVVAIGYSMFCGISMKQRGVLYFACFLIVPGIYVMLGLNYVWMLNGHAGYYKRATAIEIDMTIGNCAGLVIGQIFKNTTPDGLYLEGIATSPAVAMACAVLITGLYFYKRRQNRVRDALTPEERQAWIDQGKTGDAHLDFWFIL
ncbi:MFS general substrate transporter [Setomelanomma holmii]|uniref:MFS general substrate transporter n=1 Tax=Setomelanomma holmii TaxID=210430 RepID=A0A9P4LMJ0_9PLEO|nr:MFS general substrate transporter [Setomelanomma holmii]